MFLTPIIHHQTGVRRSRRSASPSKPPALTGTTQTTREGVTPADFRFRNLNESA